MPIIFPEGTQNYPTGIIQVVSTSDTARRELTSSLYDWTACQVSITRKATDSKLLILGQYFVLTTAHDWDGYFYSSLDGIIISLELSDKKFLDEEVKIDSSSDYVDIYLQSIKVSSNKYEIVDDGTNIVVTFNQALVAEPSSLVANDFLVKGKIVSR